MPLAIVILFYLFVAANFAYSLWLAYSMAFHADDGGYPVLGHAVHNFFALLCAAILLPKVASVSPAVRIAAGAAVVLLPALQVWLITRLDRLGEHRRAAARGRVL